MKLDYSKWGKKIKTLPHPSYVVCTGVRFIETESRRARGWGNGRELVFNGHRLSVWENEKSSIDGE